MRDSIVCGPAPSPPVLPDHRPESTGPGPHGFTLVELLFVLLLFSLLLGAALPRAGELRDRYAVRGAREGAVGLLLRARAEALAHGEAILLVTESPSHIALLVDGRPRGDLDLDDEFGVRLALSGSGDRRLLRFDALGLGRMTAATLRFTRGSATAAITVSAYGRIRRW